MKKYMIPALALMLSFSSCELLNDAIPDVDNVVTQTFNVTIDANVPVGETEKVFVDITQYDEYQEYSQYISGYTINKITYRVLDYDAPEDLYFSGSIVAFDTDETTYVTPGEIPSVNLAEVAALDEEQTLEQDQDAYDQVIAWLDDPGSFNLRFDYGFEDAGGQDYSFDQADFGSSFKVEVKIYMTLLTGL